MANSRLSKIETQWSMVRQANDRESDAVAAQSQLFDRYSPAIKKYLFASLRNEDAASEVYQEFALRLVRGDFRNADCEKGKFRNMIKTTLYRLMMDYHRRTKKRRKLGTDDGIETLPAPDATDSNSDDSFAMAWRQTLLDQTWARLKLLQDQTSKPWFTILRARVDRPELTTRQLHTQLTEESSVSIPAEGTFRVYLHRARKRFAVLLTEQVSQSINDPTPEKIESELIDLGLHHFCKV